MLSSLPTATLLEIQDFVQQLIDYRATAARVAPPAGFGVVTAGSCRAGDVRWCPTHRAWEPVEESPEPFWRFDLLARPCVP